MNLLEKNEQLWFSPHLIGCDTCYQLPTLKYYVVDVFRFPSNDY